MQNKYLQLNNVSAYKTAFHLSNYRSGARLMCGILL
jgi:hypothetical protein